MAFLRDGKLVQAVIQIARDNTGVQKHAPSGGGRFAVAAAAPATDDAELARLAASVLANLSAARELRVAARYALPRPQKQPDLWEFAFNSEFDHREGKGKFKGKGRSKGWEDDWGYSKGYSKGGSMKGCGKSKWNPWRWPRHEI